MVGVGRVIAPTDGVIYLRLSMGAYSCTFARPSACTNKGTDCPRRALI